MHTKLHCNDGVVKVESVFHTIEQVELNAKLVDFW